MSSDILARVHAFADKADDLSHKGHVLRAAENYGRAADSARVLGEDNLVALELQLLRGHKHYMYAMWALDTTTDRSILAAHRAECITLLSGAVEALERRRVAGMLLEGKCSPEEEAWCADQWRCINPHWPAGVAASFAAMVGYEQFLHAAINASNVLANAHVFSAECSDTLFEFFAQHVIRAAELMQKPRRIRTVAMATEATFVRMLRETVAKGDANGLKMRLVQLLARAWQRLERSGVLQSRRVEEAIEAGAPTQRACNEAVERSLNAPGLRICALPGCGAKEAHPAHFKSCAACRMVVYCCREHQVEGWPGHKKACKAARKAAAADDEAGPSGA